MKQTLTLPCLQVPVFLGCWPGEQDHKQTVEFFIEIQIQSTYKAIESDQIADAIDYSQIASILENIGSHQKFNLIEHLVFQTQKSLTEYLKKYNISGFLTVGCKKIKVPIASVKGGVEFRCQSTI